MRSFRFYAGLLLATLAVAGCGSEDADEAEASATETPAPEPWSGFSELPDDCEGDVLYNRVEASDWVTTRTGVHSYAYEAHLSAGVTRLILLDDADLVLGRLEASQVFGHPDGRDGSMMGTFEGAGGATTTLRTHGERVGPEGWTTQMHLATPDGEAWAESRHRIDRCWEGVEPSEGPPCAAPLTLDQGPFLLPSCGLPADGRILNEEAPALDRLTYRVAHAEAEDAARTASTSAEDTAGVTGRRVDGERVMSTFDAFRGGRMADEEAFAQWQDASAAGAIFADEDVVLLATVWADRAWWRSLEEHAAFCEVEALPAVEVEASTAEGDEPLFVQKRCAGTQDNGAWGGADTGANSSVWGDPHMVSLNGLAWDLQAAGEFVLARAHAGDAFEVQGRFEPLQDVPHPACGNLSWNTAAATEIAGVRVTARSVPAFEIRVDGEPVADDGDLPALPGGASIELGPQRVDMRWPGGEEVRFVERPSTGFSGSSLTVEVTVPRERADEVRGLLGTPDGDTATDLVMPDGEVLGWPLSFEDRYRVLAPAWRVDEGESLHDYDEGRGPDDYWFEGFPDAMTKVGDLPAAEVEAARATCRDEEIDDPHLLDACTLDTVCLDAGQGAGAADAPSPTASMPIGEDDVVLEGDIRRRDVADAPDASPDVAPESCRPWSPEAMALLRGPGPVSPDDEIDAALVDTRRLAGEEDARAPIDVDTDLQAWDVLRRTRENPDFVERATLHFSTPVVGVLVDGDVLDTTSDAFGVDLPAWEGEGRSAMQDPRDELALSDDRHTLSIRFAGSDARRVRILVEAP